MAAVNINNLLSLPKKDRKKIAEKLWNSLQPQKDEETVINLLEQRWKNIKSGKAKTISSNAFWNNIGTHLQVKG